MKLSVIIVSYNAMDFLVKCLDSLQKHLPKNSEVIVFDNNSPDREIENIAEDYPSMQFILNPENLGFGRANNRAVNQAKGEWILILNPDTVIYEDFFPALFNYANSVENLGAIGVRMLDGNGDFLPESKRNIPSPYASFSKLFSWFNGVGKTYYNKTLQPNENGKVEILSGACMFMKKQVYEEVGGFDEQYFMYGEDIDLSFSLLNLGYQNYYLGEVYITHFKGESTVKDEKYLKNFYGAMEIFIEKYHKPKNPFLYYTMLAGLKFKHKMEKLKLKK